MLLVTFIGYDRVQATTSGQKQGGKGGETETGTKIGERVSNSCLMGTEVAYTIGLCRTSTA